VTDGGWMFEVFDDGWWMTDGGRRTVIDGTRFSIFQINR